MRSPLWELPPRSFVSLDFFGVLSGQYPFRPGPPPRPFRLPLPLCRLLFQKKKVREEKPVDPELRQMPKRSRKEDREKSMPMKVKSPPAKKVKSPPAKKASDISVDVPAKETSEELKKMVINDLIKTGKVRVIKQKSSRN